MTQFTGFDTFGRSASAAALSTPPRLTSRLSGPEGVLFAREWPGDMEERDLALLRVGGRAARLAAPDAYAPTGAPIYVLSDRDAAEGQRLLDRECLDCHEFHNLYTNAGRAVILNLLATVSQTGITYFAVGSATPVSPSVSDTALVTEFFRKAISSYTVSTSGLFTDFTTVFNTTDTGANGFYGEAGLFGNGATSSLNTGTLFTHVQYVYTKSSTIILTNDYYIYLS